MKLKVSVTIGDSVIVIAGAFDVAIHGSHANAHTHGEQKFWDANWSARGKKGRKRRNPTKSEWRTYFSLCRKSSIICHLLGLKVSDESLKGSSAGNRPLKKMAEYTRHSGKRGIRAIYLPAKNRRGAGLNNDAAPERVAGIYRRDFSAKRKLFALFRAVTKLAGRHARIESNGNWKKKDVERDGTRGKAGSVSIAPAFELNKRPTFP